MSFYTIMLKPASSLCNLRCKYCFYADIVSLRDVKSYGLMSEDTVDSILKNVFQDLTSADNVTFAFQGGEPTLAGPDFFRSFFASVKKLNTKGVSVHYALQTNGTKLSSEWYPFLKEQHVLVGLSLDGPKNFHDACRVDELGKGTFKDVLSVKKDLDREKIDYNVLMTLTSSMARHPQQIWRFIKENKLDYIQFTPCLAPLEEDGTSVYALTPERFASFYIEIFRLWLQDWNAGRYTSIKFFDDVIHLISDGSINACGLCGKCTPQVVVEADGSVYPCDFYMLDDYRSGNLTVDSFHTILDSEVSRAFRSSRQTLPTLCGSCPYLKMCGGGCKRMEHSVFVAPGGTFCGYRTFLDSCGREMSQIARQLH